MKKKGFTLIELLAVIVILAVIALIATPMVLGVIENAKKGAAEASAQSYLKAVEMYITNAMIKGENVLVANQKYYLTKPTVVNAKARTNAVLAINDLVDVKGNKPTGIEDYIIMNDKYEISYGEMTIDLYSIEIEDNKIKSTVKGEKIELEDILIVDGNQTMEKGSTTTINLEFKPVNASIQSVTYKSSNTNIITVDEKGKITAVGNGTAKVTVTSKDKKDISKEIEITVITSISSVKIEKTEEKDLLLGKTIQLVGRINPNDTTFSTALTWESSNESIATVSDNGLVTGLSLGTVKIKATTINGIKDEIELEVKPVLAESVSITGESKVYVSQKINLVGTVSPDDTTDKTLTWESSDTTKATVVNGEVTGVAAGTVTISAIAQGGAKGTKEITVVLDSTGPEATITDGDYKLTINLTDNDTGLAAYAVTNSSAEPTSYTKTYTNTKTATETYTYSTSSVGKVYYIWMKDQVGNVSNKTFEIEKKVNNYSYKGSSYTFTVPKTTSYTLEVWGAEGGGKVLSGNTSSGDGGKGGYSPGMINLNKGTITYIYVGGAGQSSSSGNAPGGFNGGGQGYASSSSEPGNGGGGASDIRINSTSLYARVIVAGGGGGGGEDSGDAYGHGGGTSGVSGSGSPSNATQTTAGTNGGFGVGAGTGSGDGGGGGGGWYGGGTTNASTVGSDTQGGGGGSGYVYTSSTATNYPSGCLLNSSYYLTNAQTIAGNTSFTSPSGGTETGHSGNGYARITYYGLK